MKSLLPILMAVIAGVLYHVAQKSVPKYVNPFAAIIIAYGIGILCCLLALIFLRSERSFMESVRGANWAVWLLGISAAIIEISILLSRRLEYQHYFRGREHFRRVDLVADRIVHL